MELYCLISVVQLQEVNYVQTHLEAGLGISLATGVGGSGFKHSQVLTGDRSKDVWKGRGRMLAHW